MTPVFSFDEVVVTVEGARLLGPVTAHVPPRGVTVVVGPSGSGKTTLLRLCNRLEVPSSGSVRFRGASLAGLDPLELRRAVGMVFQRPTLLAGSVRDNLYLADADADDESLRAALDRVGLPRAMLDRDHEDLSGGEAQRVCAARTLLARPEVVLMDEPTSSLDPDTRLVVEKLAIELAVDDHPVMWVTHDLEQADRLADHRIVLVDGQVATPEQEEAFLRDRDVEGEGGAHVDD